jgi:hypothetical protein
LVLATLAARVLLHGSVYIADFAGPGTRQWPPLETFLILAGLGLSLAVVWGGLALLARRVSGWSVPLAIALVCAGTGVTLMLSAYATAGPIGFVLMASMVGATLASLRSHANMDGAVGIAVVTLFSLLVMGRFFGELSTSNAAVLLAAPLLAWLPELVRIGRGKTWLRAGLRLALTALPVVLVLFHARQHFIEESARTSPGSGEPSADDYMNFGK